MLLFYRNTHCECGKPKELAYHQKETWENHGFICHLLDSVAGRPLELVKRDADNYAETFGEETLTKEQIAVALIELSNCGLVRAIHH